MRHLAPLFGLSAFLALSPAWAAPVQGSYVLSVSSLDNTFTTAGDLTVTIGGKTFKAGADGSLKTEITGYLKPGPNPVRIRWGSRCNIGCGVQIAYATEKGRYRTVFDFKLGTYNPGRGDYTYTVVADGPRGAGRVSTGSANRQTLLKTNIPGGFVQVWVNGSLLGDFPGIVDRDISGYVRPGENTLKIVWDKKYGSQRPFGSLSVAYADRVNNFKTLWQLMNSGTAPRTATYTFTVPQ